jgi:hypothetical protein
MTNSPTLIAPVRPIVAGIREEHTGGAKPTYHAVPEALREAVWRKVNLFDDRNAPLREPGRKMGVETGLRRLAGTGAGGIGGRRNWHPRLCRRRRSDLIMVRMVDASARLGPTSARSSRLPPMHSAPSPICTVFSRRWVPITRRCDDVQTQLCRPRSILDDPA